MLSCAFSDSRVRMSPREDLNSPNDLTHRAHTHGIEPDDLTESAAFARQTIIMDADMHWEMNYHEAAIFLEVFSIIDYKIYNGII